MHLSFCLSLSLYIYAYIYISVCLYVIQNIWVFVLTAGAVYTKRVQNRRGETGKGDSLDLVVLYIIRLPCSLQPHLFSELGAFFGGGGDKTNFCWECNLWGLYRRLDDPSLTPRWRFLLRCRGRPGLFPPSRWGLEGRPAQAGKRRAGFQSVRTLDHTLTSVPNAVR